MNERLHTVVAMGKPSAFSTWFRRVFPEKSLGQRGEAVAARYLRRHGYRILARGDRLKPGELLGGAEA